MKKSIKILVAGLLLLSFVITFAGCNTAKYVGKINNDNVEKWVYTYYYSNAKDILIKNASQGQTTPVKWDDIKGNAFNATQNNEAVARDYSIERSYSYYLTQQIFDELKLKFTKEDEDKAKSYYENAKKQYAEQGGASNKPFEKYLKDEKKVSQDNIMKIISLDVKNIKIVDYYYGKKGKTPILEKDIKARFEKDWARVKHVLIKSTDDKDERLTGEKLAAAKAKAESILSRALKNENFEKLVETYSEDTEGKKEKDGFIFSKDNEIGFDQKFVTKSFELKIDGIGMQETNFGWHIIKRYALTDTQFTENKDKVLEKIQNEKLGEIFKAKRDKSTVSKDDKVINKIK